MERQLWEQVVTLLRAREQAPADSRFTFSIAAIAGVYFWAVLHDRPVYWACRPENWPAELRPARLPSPATMSRRLRRAEVLDLLERGHAYRRRRNRRRLLYYVDGKPFALRRHTRDADALQGWASGGYAKGYKLHLIGSSPADVRAWAVTPMNANEPRVAEQLVPRAGIQGYLLADANYDTNALHAACRQAGVQLLAPRRHGPDRGLGHCDQDPGRLRCIELLERSRSGFGPQLHARRDDIERQFGSYASTSLGLWALPPWVRRLHRVRLWIGAKLLLLVLFHQTVRHAQ